MRKKRERKILIFITIVQKVGVVHNPFFVLSCADGNSGEALDLHIFIIFWRNM